MEEYKEKAKEVRKAVVNDKKLEIFLEWARTPIVSKMKMGR